MGFLLLPETIKVWFNHMSQFILYKMYKYGENFFKILRIKSWYHHFLPRWNNYLKSVKQSVMTITISFRVCTIQRYEFTSAKNHLSNTLELHIIKTVSFPFLRSPELFANWLMWTFANLKHFVAMIKLIIYGREYTMYSWYYIISKVILLFLS